MNKYSSERLNSLQSVPGSFRDPKGHVVRDDQGDVFRLVTESGDASLRAVEATGLLSDLIAQKKLVAHGEAGALFSAHFSAAKRVISHPQITTVSYPYEWCFAQLKAAALLQLDLLIQSLSYDCTLSDATAFNIQFERGQPIFIDTLSFIPYAPGAFWNGQAQFSEQFLNPLLLQAWGGVAFNDIYRGAMTGVSSDLVSAVTPLARKLSWRYFNYVHLPRRAQRTANESAAGLDQKVAGRLPREGFRFILKQLQNWVEDLSLAAARSTWSDYADTRTYDDQTVTQKIEFVAECVDQAQPSRVLDIGCNTGEFSLVALRAGARHVIGLESDHQALSIAYQRAAKQNLNFLPLYQNVLNPSPDQGWANVERERLSERLNADFVLALAVLHHIVIAGNVPLSNAVDVITEMAPRGVIEWIPKSDPMVQTLLRHRDDIFDSYDVSAFERALHRCGAKICRTQTLDNGRRLYFYEVTE